jgi:hypothetical protein
VTLGTDIAASPEGGPPEGSAGHAAPARRGLPVLVAVAVAAIAAGTWLLGSGPDPEGPAPAVDGIPALTAPEVPEVPAGSLAPPLSVAPAPSEEAYAAAKRAAETRATRAEKRPGKTQNQN